MSLVGFSLGGNFALRVNAFTTSTQLKLHRTISFCPVIDPMETLLSLENSFFVYRNYFIQRWKKSFSQKASAFPDLYSRKTFDHYRTLRDATEGLAVRYAGFDSLESYLQGYSIAGNRLENLHAPAFIVLADDDPIIPSRDQEKLVASRYLNIQNIKYGGHCGFLEPSLVSPWINQFTLECCLQDHSRQS